jgi:hypothetical protein
MTQDIAIGVCLETDIGRDCHPAKNEFLSGDQSVDVVPHAGPVPNHHRPPVAARRARRPLKVFQPGNDSQPHNRSRLLPVGDLVQSHFRRDEVAPWDRWASTGDHRKPKPPHMSSPKADRPTDIELGSDASGHRSPTEDRQGYRCALAGPSAVGVCWAPIVIWLSGGLGSAFVVMGSDMQRNSGWRQAGAQSGLGVARGLIPVSVEFFSDEHVAAYGHYRNRPRSWLASTATRPGRIPSTP